MNKNKIIVSLCITIFACISFVVCFWHIRSPVSLKYIMRKLDSYLETEYRHISTHKSDGRNIERISTATYQFEDVNGVIFFVLAFPRFGDYDRTQPGYPRCNYLTAYYEFHKEAVEQALQCGLPVIWENTGYSGFRIEVSSYDELEIIAPAIEKALNSFEPLISDNYSGLASDEFEFYIPEISVWIADKKIMISAFEFRPIKGQNQWTQEEILNKLNKDYNSNIIQ